MASMSHLKMFGTGDWVAYSLSNKGEVEATSGLDRTAAIGPCCYDYCELLGK